MKGTPFFFGSAIPFFQPIIKDLLDAHKYVY